MQDSWLRAQGGPSDCSYNRLDHLVLPQSYRHAHRSHGRSLDPSAMDVQSLIDLLTKENPKAAIKDVLRQPAVSEICFC